MIAFTVTGDTLAVWKNGIAAEPLDRASSTGKENRLWPQEYNYVRKQLQWILPSPRPRMQPR